MKSIQPRSGPSRGYLLVMAVSLSISGSVDALAAEQDPDVARILAIEPEGSGNEEASAAWKALVGKGTAALPEIVRSISDASPLASNWLRSAADAILDQALENKEEIEVADLGDILMDTSLGDRSRRLAFEMIGRVDPKSKEALIPGLLNDPSADLRYPAVAKLIKQAEAIESKEAALIYRQALGAARDIEQVNQIKEALKELGREVDLQRHFGFVSNWKVVGPFDNTDREGFAAVYGPEEGVDLSASYKGKSGDVTWSDYQTADPYGMVDINKAYDMLKETVAYAYTEFESEVARPVEIRLGCKNAWKIWVNGELLFARDEYHRGIKIDQYRVLAQLKPGLNSILVKVCQNEQTETWTVQWGFQLRVCDSTGTAILAENRPPTPEKSTGDQDPRRRPKKDSE